MKIRAVWNNIRFPNLAQPWNSASHELIEFGFWFRLKRIIVKIFFANEITPEERKRRRKIVTFDVVPASCNSDVFEFVRSLRKYDTFNKEKEKKDVDK